MPQALFMPLCQVVKVAVILIGFVAALIFAGQKVPGNGVVMRLAERSFSCWFLVIFVLVACGVIAQLLAVVVIGGLFQRRAALRGALAGILVGRGLSAHWPPTKQDPIWGLNAGLVALLANIVVFFVVSLATRPPEDAVVQPFMETVWNSGRRA